MTGTLISKFIKEQCSACLIAGRRCSTCALAIALKNSTGFIWWAAVHIRAAAFRLSSNLPELARGCCSMIWVSRCHGANLLPQWRWLELRDCWKSRVASASIRREKRNNIGHKHPLAEGCRLSATSAMRLRAMRRASLTGCPARFGARGPTR